MMIMIIGCKNRLLIKEVLLFSFNYSQTLYLITLMMLINNDVYEEMKKMMTMIYDDDYDNWM